ncbi:HAD-IIB family hydrolase [Spiroplasma cantharicola]|uniref:HAD family hydrolase n=1 Tax=Spiroplasma cantharicola TaxID=362837 RepID=A0A0M3SJC6_9MOLU|nr:HAD family hydrolase [Spiroplasma cantharicola]ALD66518.1 HAD family hydrolase [Spiroplasma cantharicola]
MRKIKKIAATDMDGTIIFELDTISEENKKQLLKFQKKSNNSLTIVTGRNYFLADFAARELNINLPVICSNGASVIDPQTLKYIAKKHFKKEEIKELLEKFLDTGIEINVPNDFRTHFIQNEDWFDYLMENKVNLDFSHFPDQKVICNYESIEELIEKGLDLDESFPGLVANIKNDKQLEYVRAVVNEYDLLALEFPKEDNCRIEIYKKGVTKSWGLNKLLDKFNLSKEDIHLFGDEHNDYPMFEQFPNCYAVGNAIDGIKELSKEVIDTVQNAGVGKKLNEIVEEFQ